MCGFCWGSSCYGGIVRRVSFAVKLVEPFYVSEIVTVHIFFFFVLSAGGGVVICGH